jgi:hypothetical protein
MRANIGDLGGRMTSYKCCVVTGSHFVLRGCHLIFCAYCLCRRETVWMPVGPVRASVLTFRWTVSSQAYTYWWEEVRLQCMCASLHALWPPGQARETTCTWSGDQSSGPSTTATPAAESSAAPVDCNTHSSFVSKHPACVTSVLSKLFLLHDVCLLFAQWGLDFHY